MLWSCKGWLNSGKQYVILSLHVYRFTLLIGFVCLEMLILETYLKKLFNQAFIAYKKHVNLLEGWLSSHSVKLCINSFDVLPD